MECSHLDNVTNFNKAKYNEMNRNFYTCYSLLRRR